MNNAIIEEKENNPDGTTISFDARYSSRRHAVQCSTSFIGKSGKVLHVEHAINNQKHRKGNFNCSSSNMETFTLVNSFKNLSGKLKINKYVHDGNSISGLRLSQARFSLTEHRDLTHAIICIDNSIQSMPKKVKRRTKKIYFME